MGAARYDGKRGSTCISCEAWDGLEGDNRHMCLVSKTFVTGRKVICVGNFLGSPQRLHATHWRAQAGGVWVDSGGGNPILYLGPSSLDTPAHVLSSHRRYSLCSVTF